MVGTTLVNDASAAAEAAGIAHRSSVIGSRRPSTTSERSLDDGGGTTFGRSDVMRADLRLAAAVSRKGRIGNIVVLEIAKESAASAVYKEYTRAELLDRVTRIIARVRVAAAPATTPSALLRRRRTLPTCDALSRSRAAREHAAPAPGPSSRRVGGRARADAQRRLVPRPAHDRPRDGHVVQPGLACAAVRGRAQGARMAWHVALPDKRAGAWSSRGRTPPPPQGLHRRIDATAARAHHRGPRAAVSRCVAALPSRRRVWCAAAHQQRSASTHYLSPTVARHERAEPGADGDLQPLLEHLHSYGAAPPAPAAPATADATPAAGRSVFAATPGGGAPVTVVVSPSPGVGDDTRQVRVCVGGRGRCREATRGGARPFAARCQLRPCARR